MLTDAKPMPAMTAKTKVIAHTAHPAREVARWRVCQSPAAHDGMTSAARSAATPMAKNSHPAMSLDSSDRANQPVVVMPTPASANAAATKRIEATQCDGVTARCVTVGGGDSANAEFADEKPTGISDSEDGDSASAEGAAFAFCRLRGLYSANRQTFDTWSLISSGTSQSANSLPQSGLVQWH